MAHPRRKIQRQNKYFLTQKGKITISFLKTSNIYVIFVLGFSIYTGKAPCYNENGIKQAATEIRGLGQTINLEKKGRCPL